jgi:ubiquinone/menaquinone biosynthesis C-methylase UbiE
MVASTRQRVNRIRSMDDDAVSRAYAKQMSRFRAGYEGTAKRAGELCPDARRILDAATGSGLALAPLARRFPAARITGLDVSGHMLARAEETVRDAAIGDRVVLVRGSVYELPFEAGAFDLVIASQLIHMLDDLPAFLGEARRVLEPGGTLLVVDFRRDAPWWYRMLGSASTAVLRAFGVPMDGMGPVLAAAYTPGELAAGLRGAGFERSGVTAGIAQLVAEAR